MKLQNFYNLLAEQRLYPVIRVLEHVISLSVYLLWMWGVTRGFRVVGEEGGLLSSQGYNKSNLLKIYNLIKLLSRSISEMTVSNF